MEEKVWAQVRPFDYGYVSAKAEIEEFDMDDDGYTGSADAKLLVRYFRGRTGIELIGGLLNKLSKRRVPKDIVKFLDLRTGKDNGIEILSEFEKYTDLDRVMSAGKNMESLYPYATTIGLLRSIVSNVAVPDVTKTTSDAEITDFV